MLCKVAERPFRGTSTTEAETEAVSDATASSMQRNESVIIILSPYISPSVVLLLVQSEWESWEKSPVHG